MLIGVGTTHATEASALEVHNTRVTTSPPVWTMAWNHLNDSELKIPSSSSYCTLLLCDHCGRLGYKHLGFIMDHPRRGSTWHKSFATRIGTTKPYPFTGIGSFTMPEDDPPRLSVHGTSDYTRIQTSYVFRPGIQPVSTAWKSRNLKNK